MKIELKLTTDALLACDRILQNVYEADRGLKTQTRVMYSIVLDIAEKMGSKARALIIKQGLFDAQKKHKVTLKFHEAWAFEQFIRSMLPVLHNEYQKTLLNGVADTINQKIC